MPNRLFDSQGLDPLMQAYYNRPPQEKGADYLNDNVVQQMLLEFQNQKKIQDAHAFLTQLLSSPAYSNFGTGTTDILSKLFMALAPKGSGGKGMDKTDNSGLDLLTKKEVQ